MTVRFRTHLLQALILLIPLGAFFWLGWQNLVSSGTFVVDRSVEERSPFMDRVLPEARTGELVQDADGDWVQPVIGDPVTFFVHPHRSFSRVDVEVWFQNEDVPIVEMGVLAQASGEVYDLKPLQNLLIDRSSWHRLEEDGLLLLQREPTYASIGEFLRDLPERSRIATYHYGLRAPFRLSDYHPSSTERTIEVSLRGFHEFQTYIKDEILWFGITYVDMNRKNGADPVVVTVLNESGSPVAEVRAADDGNATDNARPSGLQVLRLEAPNLPEGVYKVQLRAEHDVFFRRFTTAQQKIVFGSTVYLADDVGYRREPALVAFWTEAKRIRAATTHAESRQTLRVGEDAVEVAEPYQEYLLDVSTGGVARGEAPKGDVVLRTDGHVAFAEDQYFNPDPVRLLGHSDLDRLGVDYVIADYQPPHREGKWLVAEASFDAGLFAVENGTWKFALSVPGASPDEPFLLGRIRLALRREPLTWNKMADEIRERLAP
ncbi:hypothetical protein HY734_03245 [Candidatus Uhrbacteria bacterium]|nr:hypothetical protein [Candidatus Uhrbacteria bacterium]